MNAFSAATDVIFADPNMAVDALWLDQGFGPGTSCRVRRKSPDQETEFGAARIRSSSTVLDVRVSEVAKPRKGDVFILGDERLEVQGSPMLDRLRLVWSIDTVPA